MSFFRKVKEQLRKLFGKEKKPEAVAAPAYVLPPSPPQNVGNIPVFPTVPTPPPAPPAVTPPFQEFPPELPPRIVTPVVPITKPEPVPALSFGELMLKYKVPTHLYGAMMLALQSLPSGLSPEQGVQVVLAQWNTPQVPNPAAYVPNPGKGPIPVKSVSANDLAYVYGLADDAKISRNLDLMRAVFNGSDSEMNEAVRIANTINPGQNPWAYDNPNVAIVTMQILGN